MLEILYLSVKALMQRQINLNMIANCCLVFLLETSNNSQSTCLHSIPKKGTIPCYFSVIEKNENTHFFSLILSKEYHSTQKVRKITLIHIFVFFIKSQRECFQKKILLNIYLSNFHNDKRLPDVLCFSETFLHLGSEQSAKLSGYKFVSHFSRSNKEKRGGVYIMVTSGLQVKHVLLLKDHAQDKIFEFCGIEIPICRMVVICLYRIPNSNTDIFYLNQI